MRQIIWVLLFTASFTGLHGQTANPGKYQYVFTVAKDGTGDYFNIQDAFDAMRVYPLGPITLYIKNGVYREKIELPATNTDVTIIGENVDSTIIVFEDYSGDGMHNTFNSFTAKISGNRFRAVNLSFVNAAGRVGQALALYVDADKAHFVNCKFIGNQDTIFTGGEGSKQLFENCTIEGTTDFIFGPGTAVFHNCHIHCKANSYITAASTPKDQKFGLVFLHCKITSDSTVDKLFLGRPWRACAKTVFLQCELPSPVRPEGWDNWNNPENEKTAFYAEFENVGPGSSKENRVKWSHQLGKKEAGSYTLEGIFGMDQDWYRMKNPVEFSQAVFTQHRLERVNLYDGNVPCNIEGPDREQAVVSGNVTRISKVKTPTLTIYKPAKPNGQSVVICPGGSYAILAFDKEGTRVAEALTSWGVTALVLKYRLPDDSLQTDRYRVPLMDAQEAIRYARRHADELGISRNKVGIMGFSAGGHLASTAATHFRFIADEMNRDTLSVRPDFAVLVYPVVSFDSSITHFKSRSNLIGDVMTPGMIRFFSNELGVTQETPPSFLVHAGDDRTVPVANSIRYYEACIANKVPAEMILYPKGGHGFGMFNSTTADRWMDHLQIWMRQLK